MTDRYRSSHSHSTTGGTPRALLLSNGRFSTLVSEAGGGGVAWGALAVTRWAPDSTRDADGCWLYVRDTDAGEFWSAAAQPVPCGTAECTTRFRPGVVELEREQNGILVRTTICVAPHTDAELRRFTIENRSDQRRELELTTYAELVLNTAAGDAGHPAFSKLFIQTARHDDATGGALLASRRLRSLDDQPMWVVQRLLSFRGEREISYETDRMRFLGRGRTTSRPVALDTPGALSGTVGNVLDPIFALRCALRLEPGESASCVSVLGVGDSELIAESSARFADAQAVDTAFACAEERARALAESVALLSSWRDVPSVVGSLFYGENASLLSPAERVDDRALYELVGARLSNESERASADARLGDRVVIACPSVLPASAPRCAPPSPRGAHAEPSAHDLAGDPLHLFNGIGGFSDDGSEYVIRIPGGTDPSRLPPLPWTNVVANPTFGFIASETGATYTWSGNSRENRLTPWLNDPVSDAHADALYVRDEETGRVWSPTPGPIPGNAPYEVRHGLGASHFHTDNESLSQDVWMFVPTDEPVKIARVRLTNRDERPRRLSLYWYAQLVLGTSPQESASHVETERDDESGALLARNRERVAFSQHVAFATVVAPDGAIVTFTADRAEMLGLRGATSSPAAVLTGSPLQGRVGSDLDPCAAYRVAVDLASGETFECSFLIGEGENIERARAIANRLANADAVNDALEGVRAFWTRFTSGIAIETPSRALNAMVNNWLPYQNLSCRMWGRSAFYQSGGAFGFRDQLQDSSALLYLDPDIARQQIMLHAAHQFAEGDALHWWHPPLSKGIRTRFSDDLLWLPYITAFYVRSTGDTSVLENEAPFITARALEPGEDEALVVPQDSGERASVYEHCCRAIDRSLSLGSHGLPLIGVGDWNDGMNRVGREGRGESVWLGFFLYEILGSFLPYVNERGDSVREERYRAHRLELRRALNAEDGGWDGEWYRRAYYDDGAPLGSKLSDECKIDVIAQAWAVLSGAAPADRAKQALDAMETHLVSEDESIIRLLTPAFDRTPHDPGYIKGYLPGVRENGGQYTHGALWAVRAMAEAGRTEQAARLLEMLNPVSHGRSAEQIEVYKGEPYVIAADVYGVAPHVGRAGWTWYTGSAGWMYRVALESVLGFELYQGSEIVLRPCIPAGWPGFTIRYRLPDGVTVYEIGVTRAATDARERTVVIGASGEAAHVADGAVRIPLATDGRTHYIEITLGADIGRRYTPSDV